MSKLKVSIEKYRRTTGGRTRTSTLCLYLRENGSASIRNSLRDALAMLLLMLMRMIINNQRENHTILNIIHSRPIYPD